MVMYISFNTCYHIWKLCVPCILLIFISYNQQTHSLFNTKLYLKKNSYILRFPSASFQGYVLSFYYYTISIQVIASRTAPFYFILLEVIFIISFYVTVALYVTATVYYLLRNDIPLTLVSAYIMDCIFTGT